MSWCNLLSSRPNICTSDSLKQNVSGGEATPRLRTMPYSMDRLAYLNKQYLAQL